VSIGGIQSNQTRQVAAVAAHLGMKCVLVQENWVVVCSVTRSTQAGMVVGFAADGRADRLNEPGPKYRATGPVRVCAKLDGGAHPHESNPRDTLSRSLIFG
jgi:hypothetical protein